MKLLFDQNISHRILKYLPADFAGSSSVKTETLINATDHRIWDFAQMNDFIIVTQDSDFNDLNLLYGSPPKLIRIRLGNLKTRVLANILIKYSEDIKKFTEDKNLSCFEIVKS
jgi:predicted nuclease of predicted toxin-antitoxin system